MDTPVSRLGGASGGAEDVMRRIVWQEAQVRHLQELGPIVQIAQARVAPCSVHILRGDDDTHCCL
jgi:hypothetical protein